MVELHDVFPEGEQYVATNYARTAFEVAIQMEELRDSRLLLPSFSCGGTFERLFERYGIEPVFVDIEFPSLQMDLELAQQQITDTDPDAVLLVHMFGVPGPVNQWVDLCEDHEMVLIEDCARALGATVNGRLVGGFGDYAFFSLQKVSPAMKGGLLVAQRGGSFSIGDASTRVTYYGPAVYGSRNQLPPVFDTRELDPFNSWLFKDYLDQCHKQESARQRRLALELLDNLGEHGFRFQPHHPGRSYYWLACRVPNRRDELFDRLRDQGVPVYKIWQEPLGLIREPDAFADQYPRSATLVDDIIHFPIRTLDSDSVPTIQSIVDSFYE